MNRPDRAAVLSADRLLASVSEFICRFTVRPRGNLIRRGNKRADALSGIQLQRTGLDRFNFRSDGRASATFGQTYFYAVNPKEWLIQLVNIAYKSGFSL